MILTLDIEPDWGFGATYALESVVPRLLNLFDNHDVEATFFCVASMIKKHEDIFKEIAKKHEIASHTYSHRILTHLAPKDLKLEIQKSKSEIERFGFKCLGLRAPFFKANNNVFQEMEKNGFSYYSGLDIDAGHIMPCCNNLVNLPVSRFLSVVPLGLPYVRLFHPFSSRIINAKIKKKLPSNTLFYLHPHEMLEGKLPKEVKFRTLQKLNSGKKAYNIFEPIIKNLVEAGEPIISCRKYLGLD